MGNQVTLSMREPNETPLHDATLFLCFTLEEWAPVALTIYRKLS